jgi:asparagine synthase (glutamine-hydrolysing)
MSIYRFKIKLLKDCPRPAFGNNKLLVEEENLHPGPDIYNENGRQLIILGSPIYCNKIDNKTVSRKLFEKGINKSLIEELDGSFLLIFYDEKKFGLSVVNDRFASIPFYYCFSDGNFIGSLNYGDIWNELGGAKDFTVDKEAFYEFIHLQRLLGNKTYDAKTKYLDSASILTLDSGNGDNFKLEKYWRPNFAKKYRATSEASHMLADLTRNAILERISDEKRYALLLSGGLDSRLILAGLQKPIECLTVGSRQNNEYLVAKELANAKKYPHSFIKRPDSHYADILEEASFLGGSMNMYTHAHFLNLDKELKAKADVFFHGHGFDYMFQGKYLPYKALGMFNKKTYIKRMKNIDKDIRNEFLSQISYRIKSVDPLSLVIDKEKKKIKESIYSSVEKILKEGRDCCNDNYDLWEYLVMHNLSRHYTSLNISSIRTFAEERTIAFDNQLLDFYLSLPAESRLNKKIFVDAIKLLDGRLYKIRNANTNFNIYDSDFALTAKLSANKILRKFGFKVILPPEQRERSWPVKSDIISENNKIREAAKNLLNSLALEELGFLDMNKVRFYLEKHFERGTDHSDLILTLITIDTFIKNSKKSPSYNYV